MSFSQKTANTSRQPTRHLVRIRQSPCQLQGVQLLQGAKPRWDFRPVPTPSLPIPFVGHKCSLDIRVSSSTSWVPLFSTPLPTKSLYLPPVCHSDNQDNYPFPRSVHLSYATRITLSQCACDRLSYPFPPIDAAFCEARTLSFRSRCLESLAQCLGDCRPRAAKCQMNNASRFLSLVTK